MEYQLYIEKPLYKRVYTFPLYMLPLLVSKTHHVIQLFIVIFSIFLFLLTCWSDKLRLLFTMRRIILRNTKKEDSNIGNTSITNPNSTNTFNRYATHIFYRNKICKLKSNVFTFKRSKYLIKDTKIIKLVPNIKRSFEYFKEGYKNESFINLKYIKDFPKNYIEIECPTFIKMFCQHACSPFFVLQVFSGLLWCLDEYVYQSLFTLFMLICVEAGLVFQRLCNLKQFRSFNNSVIKLEMIGTSVNSNFNCSNVLVDSTDLYPGSIIRIRSTCKIPCDLLLLKGRCAVDESILTGECIPIMKEDIKDCVDRIFCIKKDKKHVLYGGTEIVKIEEELECFVLQTGFDTIQGELIKKMMSNDEITVNDKEAFGFIGVLLLVATCAAAYTWKEGLKLGKTGYKIFLECVMIITNVVPTELPLEMSLAINSSVNALRSLGVYCLEPFRIPYAGKINVCCFDKTGTLTESKLEVEGVLYCTPDTVHVLKTCNSLIEIDGKIVGDPMETSTFKYLNTISRSEGDGRKDNQNSFSTNTLLNSNNILLSSNTSYNIKKTFGFTSEMKRMTVVYESRKQYYVSMKGAPEIIKQFLVNIPEYYEEYLDYAKKGSRVIALCHKLFKKQGSYTRKETECAMHFAGFILFECKLKTHAKETITVLQESGHKVLIITGDNLLTGMSVGSKLGIKGKGVEGKNIDKIIYSDTFEEYNIFGRADPLQKEHIIERYNRMGYYTLMCGDGTNDVGALKSAHVGVAMVEPSVKKKTSKLDTFDKLVQEINEQNNQMGDASVAAPFTAKTNSLESILNIIRHGRSALVTTIQMYKILALNSLISAFSLSILDCMGVKFGEYQLVTSGLLIAFAFIFLSKNTSLKEISRQRPLTSIFSKYILISLFLQVVIHIGSYILVLKKVKTIETIVYDEKFKPSLTNTALFLLSTSTQISTFLVNYIGRPFRESLLENRKLFGSLMFLLGFVFYILFDMNDEFNLLMEVVSLGSLKIFVGSVILCDILICFCIEKMCFRLFML